MKVTNLKLEEYYKLSVVTLRGVAKKVYAPSLKEFPKNLYKIDGFDGYYLLDNINENDLVSNMYYKSGWRKKDVSILKLLFKLGGCTYQEKVISNMKLASSMSSIRIIIKDRPSEVLTVSVNDLIFGKLKGENK